MMMFWIIAVILIIAALLFLLPPLMQRSSPKEVVERDALNINLHKDQLAELGEDLQNGTLSQDQYAKAKQDLERNLIENVRGTNDGSTEENNNATGKFAFIERNAAVFIGIALPIVSFILYQGLGAGIGGIDPTQSSSQAQPVNAEAHEGNIEGMIAKLQERLAENPKDAEGWTMLGRSYYFQKKHLEASQAYAKAVALIGENNPDLLADYADTLAVASNRQLTGRPYELVKKALTLQPFHQKSLWLAGTAAYQEKDFSTALGYWEKLLQVFPPESESAQQISKNVQELKVLMGDNSVASGSQSSPAQLSATSSNASSTPVNSVTAVAGAKVSGVVKIASVLATNAAPTDTVFIFAKAASGPRMPLAIIRKQVKDLPITFTLDDTLAMNPAMKLSNFPEVVVSARVSKSGNAMPQSGDFKGSGPVVKVGKTNLEIIINTIVP